MSCWCAERDGGELTTSSPSSYFRRLQPWTALLSVTLDRNPLDVRQRSPLLFHAILLVTVYYRPRTPDNLALYRAISSILDSLLAPQILCPQPDQLSSDFIRALQLLLLYKPVQTSMFNARGVSDPSTIEHASKMNVRASWLLRLLISRVSAFIGLPSITTAYARAFALSSGPVPHPIPEQIIAEQRMYFACVFHESHGALQSGKPANFIPQEALKTTRLFATQRQQVCDVRLAASVELAATAATVLSRRQEGDLIDAEDLRRFDEEMESWREYWGPVLAGVADEDELVWTAGYPYAAFIRVVVNGFAFTRWKAQQKSCAAQGLPAPNHGGVLEAERDSIEKAVQAAEGILLAVSVEGKTTSRERGIEPSWKGVRSMLTLDREMANSLRWATDSLACVVSPASTVCCGAGADPKLSLLLRRSQCFSCMSFSSIRCFPSLTILPHQTPSSSSPRSPTPVSSPRPSPSSRPEPQQFPSPPSQPTRSSAASSN